jgi:hypothetical protein
LCDESESDEEHELPAQKQFQMTQEMEIDEINEFTSKKCNLADQNHSV